jgi:hypothetical protein
MTKKIDPKRIIVGTGRTVCDYWAWAFSDVLGNTERGVLAEYLVALALGIDRTPRQNWLPYDLLYEDKIRIEIKSSAYVQSWHQDSLSKIIFGISKTRSWDPENNSLSEHLSRESDIYVFSLYKEKEKDKANTLDVTMWEFHVLSTEIINDCLGAQKTIGLSSLKKYCQPVAFDKLKDSIDKIIQNKNGE